MKKKATIVLSILIAVTLAATTAAVTVPFEDSTIVEPFEASFQDEIVEGWESRFASWGGIDYTNSTIEDGKLKTTYPASTPHAVWRVKIDGPDSNHIGIGFWMDASAVSSDFVLRLLIAEGSTWAANKLGETVYLVPDTGNPSAVELYGDTYGNFDVPAGFVGRIMIHIDSFDDKDGLTTEIFRNGESQDFRVTMQTGFSEPTVVYYDNIRYLTAAGDTETTVDETTVDETTVGETTAPSDNSNILYVLATLMISWLAGFIAIKKKVLS